MNEMTRKKRVGGGRGEGGRGARKQGIKKWTISKRLAFTEV